MSGFSSTGVGSTNGGGDSGGSSTINWLLVIPYFFAGVLGALLLVVFPLWCIFRCRAARRAAHVSYAHIHANRSRRHQQRKARIAHAAAAVAARTQTAGGGSTNSAIVSSAQRYRSSAAATASAVEIGILSSDAGAAAGAPNDRPLAAVIAPESGLRILSLDGGGVRGLVEIAILKEIEESTGKPIHELFDLIVGTSTGGLLSLAIGVCGAERNESDVAAAAADGDDDDPNGALDMTLDRARDLYYRMANDIFAESGCERCATCCTVIRTGALYDTDKLLDAFDEYLSPLRMNDERIRASRSDDYLAIGDEAGEDPIPIAASTASTDRSAIDPTALALPATTIERRRRVMDAARGLGDWADIDESGEHLPHLIDDTASGNGSGSYGLGPDVKSPAAATATGLVRPTARRVGSKPTVAAIPPNTTAVWNSGTERDVQHKSDLIASDAKPTNAAATIPESALFAVQPPPSAAVPKTVPTTRPIRTGRMVPGSGVVIARRAYRPHVAVVSTYAGVTPPQLFVIRNYPNPTASVLSNSESKQFTVSEAAHATSAAPTYFVPLLKDRTPYLDGGLMANNPTEVAVNEATALFPNRPIACIVSVGTGKASLTAQSGGGGGGGDARGTAPSVLTLGKMVVDLATESERVHTRMCQRFGVTPAERTGVTSYFRFNPEGINIALDEGSVDRLEGMEDITRVYTKSYEVQSAFAKLKPILLRTEPATAAPPAPAASRAAPSTIAPPPSALRMATAAESRVLLSAAAQPPLQPASQPAGVRPAHHTFLVDRSSISLEPSDFDPA